MRRASAGSFLFAIFILGVYIFAHWQMNAQHQKLQDLLRIQKKIESQVAAAPRQPAGHFWDDLRQVGAVSDEDAETLKKHGYEYVPLKPDSAADAVLFRQRQGDDYERHVYRNGTTGYERRWRSPGEQWLLCDVRGAAGTRTRLARFFSLPGKRPLGEFPIDGYERAALWSPAGDLVVMNASPAGTKEPIVLWHVSHRGARQIAVPPELNLDSLLALQTPHADAQWGLHHLEAKRWFSARELFVFAQGAGTFVDPARNAKMGFNMIYHIVLEVSPDKAQVKSRRKQHFAASEMKH